MQTRRAIRAASRECGRKQKGGAGRMLWRTLLFREQQQIFEQMPTNWVEFRDLNGTLIYFTTLVTYRRAISAADFV